MAGEQLLGFFMGWLKPPSPATHWQLLRGSQHLVLALDEASGQVVGFVTALSDGVLSAYIPHLEMLPAYQGRGIGSALMQQMLNQLRDLYTIDLICDPTLQPWDERLGMRQGSAIVLRNYERQSGAEATEGALVP